MQGRCSAPRKSRQRPGVVSATVEEEMRQRRGEGKTLAMRQLEAARKLLNTWVGLLLKWKRSEDASEAKAKAGRAATVPPPPPPPKEDPLETRGAVPNVGSELEEARLRSASRARLSSQPSVAGKLSRLVGLILITLPLITAGS